MNTALAPREKRFNNHPPQEDRPLPASMDAEKGVLSSVLQNPCRLDNLGDITRHHFHHPAHGTVWECLVKMRAAGKPIDLVTVTQDIADRNLLDHIGGPAILAELQIFLPVSDCFQYYADILKEKADCRALIKAGEDLVNAAYEQQSREPSEILDEHKARLQSISRENVDAPLFIDLSPLLDGSLKQELPTVAEAQSGKFLFYAGRLNEIHAEPGTGKTNILLAATISILEAGGGVLYIDPEDTARRCVSQLLSFGASKDDIRERVYYLHNPDPKEILTAQVWAREHKPDMVILDGLAESMAAVGLNEDKAGEVLQFFRENLRPFAEAGAAVVIADHVTKSTEGRGQFARGSGAKAGRYDGVSYEIVSGKSYTPTIEGFVKLKIAKDRNGGVGPRGKIVAELHFTPNAGANGGTITSFREPADKQEGPFRPTAIMEKIRKHLTVNGASTKRILRNLGNHEAAELAIDLLVQEGEITMTQKGQSKVFALTTTP